MVIPKIGFEKLANIFPQVTVTINDINDNPAVIQQSSPVSVTVLEHSAVGTLITVITAVDILDYGDNTHVVYEIISGNEDCKCSFEEAWICSVW